MRIAIRADASADIGSGHVMRCLTLAEALREKNVQTLFISREHPGNLNDLIEMRGFPVKRLLPAEMPSSSSSLLHASWLGADERTDAEQTIEALKQWGSVDWLVVDHYALDAAWETSMRDHVNKIMVIDDLADRAHDCDMLLDQNLVAQFRSRYSNKVPEHCAMLLGPEYALLNPVYADLHQRVFPRVGKIQRILIFFGGSSQAKLTGRALSAFLQLGRADIEVDVVLAGDDPDAQFIRDQAHGHPNIHLHGHLPTLARLMAKADLAIGGGGATSWERLCLGLPSLVVTLAENQGPIAEELSRRALVRWLGHHNEVHESVFRQALEELLQQGLDQFWSMRCLEVLDGDGVRRVSAAVMLMADTPLQIRYAGPNDESLLLEWANDPVTRRNAFSPAQIPADTHHTWFHNRLRNQDGCRFYIVETLDGIPIGQVRFERQGHAWEVHYALAPEFRGRGIGRHLLGMALAKLREEGVNGLVIGQVKIGNFSSQKIFETLGFESQLNTEEQIVIYQRSL